MKKILNERKKLWLSVLRTLLTLGASMLLGKSFMGSTLSSTILDAISGTLLMGFTLLWSFYEKQVKIEAFEAFIRHLITSIGGFFIGTGKLDGNTMEQLLALAPAVVALLQSYLSRKKNGRISNKKIYNHELTKL